MEDRLEELDSIRGIAAFAVLLGHFMLIIPENNIVRFIEFGPLRFLVAGSEAVILFFVISGFVLSLPFYRHKKIIYWSYLYKRLLRIYLPYYVAFLTAILLSYLFYSGEIAQLSSWFNNAWKLNNNFDLFLDHILLIVSFSNSNYNPVLWSLVHEMRISIIFPILMLLIIRLKWSASIALGILISSIGFTLYLVYSMPYHDYFYTFHYTLIFICGAVLAKHRIYLIEIINNFSALKKVLFSLFGLFLYLYVKPAFALKILIGDRDPFLATILDSIFVAFGACILILISLSTPFVSKILLIKPLKFLGKISYSLYLYHCIILFTFTHLFYEKISIWLIWLCSLIVSVGVAIISYYFVEIPSIKLGKTLTTTIYKTNYNFKNYSKIQKKLRTYK